jgi:hypothetical protein
MYQDEKNEEEKAEMILLTPGKLEDDSIIKLCDNLKFSYDVSIALQSESRNMRTVRNLFDALIEKYPQMNTYLGVRATIISDPDFEKFKSFTKGNQL